MKILIIIKKKEFDWLRDYFSTPHPLLTSICNKPFLEYSVDFAIHCGIKEIHIATDESSVELENFFGDGDRWGAEITYSRIDKNDNPDTILRKNEQLGHETGLLIMHGFFFLHYDKKQNYSELLKTIPYGKLSECSTGYLMVQNPELSDHKIKTELRPFVKTTPIKSIRNIQSLSMNVLFNKAHQYFLPGYNNETGVFIGRNVKLAKTVHINKPVMIGNNTQIHAGAVIGPGAVIGNDVIIDADCNIQNSVIHNRTYVGKFINLNKKIVTGRTLLDPFRGTIVHMEDPQLLSEVTKNQTVGIFKKLYNSIITAISSPKKIFSLIVKPFINKLQELHIN